MEYSNFSLHLLLFLTVYDHTNLCCLFILDITKWAASHEIARFKWSTKLYWRRVIWMRGHIKSYVWNKMSSLTICHVHPFVLDQMNSCEANKPSMHPYPNFNKCLLLNIYSSKPPYVSSLWYNLHSSYLKASMKPTI